MLIESNILYELVPTGVSDTAHFEYTTMNNLYLSLDSYYTVYILSIHL